MVKIIIKKKKNNLKLITDFNVMRRKFSAFQKQIVEIGPLAREPGGVCFLFFFFPVRHIFEHVNAPAPGP